MKNLLPALATLLLLSGCASQSHQMKSEPAPAPSEASAAAPAAPLVPPGEAKVGDRTTCPVSGDEFTVEADTLKHEHAGRTFYVCCDHCVDALKEDPEKHLGKYVR